MLVPTIKSIEASNASVGPKFVKQYDYCQTLKTVSKYAHYVAMATFLVLAVIFRTKPLRILIGAAVVGAAYLCFRVHVTRSVAKKTELQDQLVNSEVVNYLNKEAVLEPESRHFSNIIQNLQQNPDNLPFHIQYTAGQWYSFYKKYIELAGKNSEFDDTTPFEVQKSALENFWKEFQRIDNFKQVPMPANEKTLGLLRKATLIKP